MVQRRCQGWPRRASEIFRGSAECAGNSLTAAVSEKQALEATKISVKHWKRPKKAAIRMSRTGQRAPRALARRQRRWAKRLPRRLATVRCS